jgi:hypothetical protein
MLLQTALAAEIIIIIIIIIIISEPYVTFTNGNNKEILTRVLVFFDPAMREPRY